MDYIPNNDKDRKDMLDSIGVPHVRSLFLDVPNEIFLKEDLKVNHPMSELEVKQLVTKISKKNKTSRISFLGAGSYRHFIPSTVSHIISRSEFYTAYTPYQPEISQGTLRSIFE